jgi:hypothetical protein
MSETQLKEYIRLSRLLLQDKSIVNAQKIHIEGTIKYLSKNKTSH